MRPNAETGNINENQKNNNKRDENTQTQIISIQYDDGGREEEKLNMNIKYLLKT